MMNLLLWEYLLSGFRVLRKAGIKLPVDLKEANPNKLLHELSGLRKKLKLEIPSLRLEEVSGWCGK